jgi:2-polyprenyl-3-methyl-5-hydroxy-6-metoxy-1,4-benzoquinol methylase
MNEDVYKNYTTTSVLTGVDVNKFTSWSHAYFKTYILPYFPKNKDSKILEIGCGYGRYTQLITKELGYHNTVGMDISEEQIEFAKKNYGLTNVFKDDALDYLNRSNEKYDVVILMDVLEHLDLDYSIKLLSKVNDSLNPNGKFIIQVPNGLSPMKPIFYGDVTHIRAFSVNSMTQLLRMSGFNHFEHHALPPLVHSVKSFLHRIIWSGFVNPLLYLFMLASHGSAVGGVYSSNLLTVVHKK